MTEPYRVHFTSAAERADEKLSWTIRRRVRASLDRLATDLASPTPATGKRVKTLRGTKDSVQRLRVGDYRVMYDVIADDRTILVLGIVHRSDLGRWLRSR